ncbi:class I SAM-dependent methyltransferase [Malonomonas rubra]|uniref:class I SAM-dependent methyltransferase n=1 Tax=Malonomonas rubra TaxID=57040 RepID=UPI0026F30E60|nr:methyltransferase domain-containing protein [Malonomonas rubra]
MEKVALRAVYNRVARRYDFQHAFFTAGSDQRGRCMLVENAVSRGNRILDCGSGTGSTALLALEKAGPSGNAVLFDMSDGMLAVAKKRIAEAGMSNQAEFKTGDMLSLPFEDNCFDVALSTYSMCPLYDPAKGARELYRVTKPGGLIGVAHSTDPINPAVKWIADRVENLVWHIPSISLGCRSVSVLPSLEQVDCEIIFKKYLGIPLRPFLVFVAKKPAT